MTDIHEHDDAPDQHPLDVVERFAVANGWATRSNNAFTGSAPSRSRAWKIADFDGNLTGSTSGSAHANPSVNSPNTSS